MSKIKKSPRPKAETPKGFKDDFGHFVRERRNLLAKLTDLYDLFGFEPLETSAIETVEALGKFLPDVDRPNEGVFAWEDDDAGWLALRYDLTAPLARVAAQYRNELPFPYRRYAMGTVWRNEKPGPGRFRQFYQCDADTVGSNSIVADAEIISLMANSIEAAGVTRNNFVVKVNNRKVLNGVLEAAGIYNPKSPDENSHQKDIVLRTIDKFDRFGVEGVRALLGEGRKDESGDFTEGARLETAQIDRILNFVNARGKNTQETLNNLLALVDSSEIGKKGVEELSQISELVRAEGFSENEIAIDPSVVRGLGYYTGPVFEAELTFQVFDEKGQARNFGSVAGGGRYDDLVKRFTGQEVPAVGMSIGVDRLLAALTLSHHKESNQDGPVIVTVMDKNRIQDYQAMVSELRQAGIRAESYLGNPKDFGKQLKYADKRMSPFAIIEGTTEHEAGVVLVKDLALGAKLAEELETREEWQAQPAQETVPREKLISYLLAKLQK